MKYLDAIKAVNNSTFSFLADGNIRIDNASIIFKNFAGKPTNLNPAGGKRTFNLCLSPEFADRLKSSGWNIKVRELDDGERLFYTEIVVNDQSSYPPKIYKLSEFMGKKSMVLMTPDQYFKLDQDNLVNIDMDIHPYTHNRGFEGATKGYLKNMWASVESVNDFGGKYADYQLVEA